MQRRNVFAGPYLDRLAHLREDDAWFAEALHQAHGRVIPVWNARNLVTDGTPPRAAFTALRTLPPELRSSRNFVLLGRVGSEDFFACEIESLEAPQLLAATHFDDLRLVASLLPADEAGLLGYARAMVSWRRKHRFCGVCGAENLSTRSGHVLVCTNAACRHEHFPRLDPAIIVLVSDGDRALLGRQSSWPMGRYSTIAGFVEPGESLEDAVAREVLEETGIEVDRIEYHSSQPWPFPASLMLGFTAHAVTHEVQRRDDELEDVRWFSRAEIAEGTPQLPPNQSISFSLIEHWYDAGAERPLRDIHGAEPWPQAR